MGAAKIVIGEQKVVTVMPISRVGGALLRSDIGVRWTCYHFSFATLDGVPDPSLTYRVMNEASYAEEC